MVCHTVERHRGVHGVALLYNGYPAEIERAAIRNVEERTILMRSSSNSMRLSLVECADVAAYPARRWLSGGDDTDGLASCTMRLVASWVSATLLMQTPFLLLASKHGAGFYRSLNRAFLYDLSYRLTFPHRLPR